MHTVLLLMASPGSEALSPRNLMRVAGMLPGPPRWLHEDEAAEWDLDAHDPTLELTLREALGDLPIDIALIPAANRAKKLLVADMDSTFIAQECIDELGIAAGAGEAVTAITYRAMRGELDFEGALRERVALMAGLSATVIDDLIAKTDFTPGGKTLVATMKAHGAHTALVSGGFTQFTAHVAGVTGFHEHRANELIITDGKIEGRVREPILGRASKVTALAELTTRLGITTADAITVGDGANDIGMIEAAGMGVAFRAKPNVRAAANVRIDHGDLSALLYLQGFRREDWKE
jgi:phosphoserine phosphatase